MTPRIALMADSTESLEPLFLPKKERHHLFPMVLKNSSMERCVKKNFLPGHMIPITLHAKGIHSFSFEKLPWNSDAPQKIKDGGITHLLAPYPCSEKFQNWAKKRAIHLLTTPPALQQKLEHKHYFDHLLKQYGIDSPKTFTRRDLIKRKINHQRFVAQRLLGNGSYVTHSMTGEKLKGLIIPWSDKDVLIREYVDGIPLGVSIFVDQRYNFFYSALRRQCFTSHGGISNFNKFIGVQWLPSSYFSARSLHALSRVLKKLTHALIRNHYIGVANIDAVLSKENAYILECNPRLSSATPQIFSVTHITGSSNPWRFFLNSLLRTPNKKLRVPSLPDSDFSGATLDLEMKNKRRGGFHKPGIYAYSKNRIAFVSDTMDRFPRGLDFFALIHEAPYPGYTNEKTIPCSIISNAPLYHFETGTKNERGIAISRFVHALV